MSSPSFFIYTEILTHKSYIKLKSIKFEHMELSFMQNIGDTLKFIRKSKNLTQQETCTNALSRSNYQKIENNKIMPSMDRFIQILLNFNMTLEEFEFVNGTLHLLQKKISFIYTPRLLPPQKQIFYSMLFPNVMIT